VGFSGDWSAHCLPTGNAGPFSASGRIELTTAVAGRVSPLSAVRDLVPPELYQSVTLFVAEDTPGFITPGQAFTGRLTNSDWEPARDASVYIAHHSWFTADVPVLLADPEVNETRLIGLAWGTFDLSRGEADFYQGSYALLIGGPLGGKLVLQDSCPADATLSAAISRELEREVTVRAAIAGLTDRGDFSAGPAAARGSFRGIGPEGTVTVTADGCLGAEVATFAVVTEREPD